MSAEPHVHRLRRMQMRSMRRGIKEMDLILNAYAQANLARMNEVELDLYDLLLEENDHDLYAWVAGQQAPPARYEAMIGDIAATMNGTAPRG